ncbi:MAG: hypothetical protein ACE5QW_01550 [Thermoplasmata archaeon]
MVQAQVMTLVNKSYELMFRGMPKALERNGIEITKRDFHNKEIKGRMILGPPWNNAEFHMKFYHSRGYTLIEANVKKHNWFRKNEVMKRLMESLIDDIEKIGNNQA